MLLLNEALLVGAGQGLLLCVVILSIPANRVANRLLAAYVGLESLHLLYLHIAYFDTSAPPAALLRLLFCARTLSGPLLYLYVRALTNPGFRTHIRQLQHLWVLLFVFAWFGILASDPDWLSLSTNQLWTMPSTSLLAIYQSLVVGGYALVAYRVVGRHQHRLQQAVSEVDNVDLTWLQRLLIAMVIISLLHLGVEAFRLLNWIAPVAKAAINLTVTLLLIYLVSIGGLRQPQVFNDGLRAALGALEDESDDEPRQAPPAEAKYRKSGLDQPRRHEIWSHLQLLLREHQPYLEPGLDLPGLAEQLDVKPHELSEVINTCYGGSFYDLINHHRIEAAKSLLHDNDEQHRKMLDIALSVGFRSQSTFYSHFKKQTGMTPTAYRQQGDA